MPTWLSVMLGVWGAVLPVAFVIARWGAAVTRRLDAIAQWFDKESALGQQHGTLPEQVQASRAEVQVVRGEVASLKSEFNQVTGAERIVERVAAIEIQVDNHEQRVRQLESESGRVA